MSLKSYFSIQPHYLHNAWAVSQQDGPSDIRHIQMCLPVFILHYMNNLAIFLWCSPHTGISWYNELLPFLFVVSVALTVPAMQEGGLSLFPVSMTLAVRGMLNSKLSLVSISAVSWFIHFSFILFKLQLSSTLLFLLSYLSLSLAHNLYDP